MASFSAFQDLAAVLLVFLGLPISGFTPAFAQENLPLLTTFKQVRELSLAEAGRRYPVRLRGVITVSDPVWKLLFVQEDSAGIYVYSVDAIPPVTTAQVVEVEGVTGAGAFAPILFEPRFRVLGGGALPSPRPVKLDALPDGALDSQWIEVEGIVRAVTNDSQHASLDIAAGNKRISAFVPGFKTTPPPTHLVDSRVSLRGVCTAVLNQRKQLVGAQLHLPSLDQITIKEPGSGEPFLVPERSIAGLRKLNPQDLFPHRVRVSGKVVLVIGQNACFVRDQSGAILVQMQTPVPLQAGDQVEAAGFPTPASGSAELQNAVVKRLGPGTPPGLTAVTAAQVLEGDFDGELIRIEGRVMDQAARTDETVLLVKSAKAIFEAVLRRDAASGISKAVPVGSTVRVTGACSIPAEEAGQARSFRLLLGSAAEVAVLRRPSWWTPAHTLAVLGGLAAMALAAAAWAISLRRQVQAQTELVRRRFAAEAALEQRYSDSTAALSSLGLKLSAATHPEKAAQIIADTADALFGWDACTLDLYSAKEDSLRPLLTIDTVNGQRLNVALAPGEKPSPRARQVLVAGPKLVLRESPVIMPVDALPFGDKARPSAALMFAPVRDGAEVIGILSVQSYTPNAYTSEQLETLQTLADHCGGALKRMRAEEALREAEKNYHSIFDNVVEGLARATPDGRFLTVNPALARMLGYSSPAELVASVTNLGAQLYVDPACRGKLLRILQEHGFLKAYEAEAYRKDGTKIWVSISSSVVRDAQGAILFFESVIEDITEHKRAEVALRESEERFRRLVEQAADAIFLFDRKGRFVDVNQRACESLGYTRAELLALDISEVEPGLALEKLEELRNRLARGEPLTLEDRHRRRDGALFPVEVRIGLIESEGRDLILALARDITDRVALETHLRHSQKLESVGKLAAGVAHDFNNILTIIQGYANVLQHRRCSEEMMGDALGQISHAAQRAANLTRQLLAFSRKQLMQPRPLDLNEAVVNVTRILQRVIGENIALEFTAAPGLPFIHADPGMIEQVIMNLVVNARDALPKGGAISVATQAVEITEAYRTRNPEAVLGHHVCLKVRDNGVGMDAATLSRIFEPFFTTKDVGKGTGLGLSTVYGIVKQHHGWVEVASEVGRGSTFRILLPAMADATPASMAENAPQTASLEGRETILLVEDEPMVRSLASQVLQSYGYRVLEAGSGLEALAVWRDHQAEIELLLTDVVMPEELNGCELARRLQGEKSDLKVIFTSGYSEEVMGPDSVLVPRTNFLAKPYRPAALVKAVRDCLDDRPNGIACDPK